MQDSEQLKLSLALLRDRHLNEQHTCGWCGQGVHAGESPTFFCLSFASQQFHLVLLQINRRIPIVLHLLKALFTCFLNLYAHTQISFEVKIPRTFPFVSSFAHHLAIEKKSLAHAKPPGRNKHSNVGTHLVELVQL